MRENIAEKLLVILDHLGVKAIATEDVAFHWLQHWGAPAQHRGHKPNVTSQKLFRHFYQGCKDSLKCWDGEVSTSF